MDGWLAYVLVGVAVMAISLTVAAALRYVGRGQLPPALPDSDDSHPELILGDMTAAMSFQTPGSSRDRSVILPELLRAGYYRPTALTEFQAVRTALILTPLVAAVGTALLVSPAAIPWVLAGGLVLAMVGYSVPRLYVGGKAAARQAEVERGLPIFADLLSIALMAGQSLLLAMSRVTTQLKFSYPGLATELEIVLRQAELLNLATAFELWAERSQVEEVRNISVIVTQSQKLGNDPSTVLMDYANNLRVGLRQKADAQAQRTSFWLLFPTIGFLWVPAIILLLGPAFFEFSKKRDENKATLKEGFNTLKKDNQRGQTPADGTSTPGNN